MSDRADDEVCQICDQDWAWHKAVKPQHEFVGADDKDRSLRAARAAQGSDAPPPNRDPAAVHEIMNQQADPMLRALLVYKGFITPEELTEFQQMMSAGLASTGAMVFGENYSSEATRRDSGAGDEGDGQPGLDRGSDPSDGNGSSPE